jgi:hypothetical protein
MGGRVGMGFVLSFRWRFRGNEAREVTQPSPRLPMLREGAQRGDAAELYNSSNGRNWGLVNVLHFVSSSRAKT